MRVHLQAANLDCKPTIRRAPLDQRATLSQRLARIAATCADIAHYKTDLADYSAGQVQAALEVLQAFGETEAAHNLHCRVVHFKVRERAPLSIADIAIFFGNAKSARTALSKRGVQPIEAGRSVYAYGEYIKLLRHCRAAREAIFDL